MSSSSPAPTVRREQWAMQLLPIIDDALEFIERLRTRLNARLLTHGRESWHIFAQLCRAARARGKLVADAYHAALATEHGCELITADADFGRFPGLRQRHPLA